VGDWQPNIKQKNAQKLKQSKAASSFSILPPQNCDYRW